MDLKWKRLFLLFVTKGDTADICERAWTNQPRIKILVVCLFVCLFQLTQAQTGKFNVHVHVEYEWRLQNEDLDESEDEMEDKVGWFHVKHLVDASWFWCLTVRFLQPIPNRREERPVSCFVPGSGPNLAALAWDAANLVRDKQRPQVPSMMISNETYGTMLDLNLPPPGPTPPLPPRVPSRGQSLMGWGWGVIQRSDSGGGLNRGQSLVGEWTEVSLGGGLSTSVWRYLQRLCVCLFLIIIIVLLCWGCLWVWTCSSSANHSTWGVRSDHRLKTRWHHCLSTEQCDSVAPSCVEVFIRS